MKFIYSFFFLLISYTSFTQNNAKIIVPIVDEKGAPTEGATVSLLNAKDSMLVKTSLTDKKGVAEFENLKPGNYVIMTTRIGYKKQYVAVEFRNETVTSKVIKMEGLSTQLKEVVVEAKKPFIERRLDKVIVNVENSIISAGSSAFEVLERSPGVIVDQNDNITLKGKPGVIIMIDGKPSPLSGSDLASFLRSMTSNAVERIEIMANPSARYDASGNAGIINIVMKKDKRMGTNGSINASIGQGINFRTNSGLNLNFRNKNVNVYGSYNYAYRKFLNDLTINRSFFSNGQRSEGLDLFNHMLYPNQSHNTRLGLDYFIGKKTIIGILAGGLLYKQDKYVDNLSTKTDDKREAVSYLSTNSNTYDLLKHYGINLNLKHAIDSLGQDITIDLDKIVFDKTSDPHFITRYFDLNQNTIGTPFILDGNLLSRFDIYSIKSDYNKPLKNGIKIQAGVKSSFVKTDNDLKFYDNSNGTSVYDVKRSNHFLYTENINAAYVSLSRELKKLSLQAGLRAEQANIEGVQQANNQRLDTSYLRLFPSAFLTYKLHANHELGLSFSRRITRPSYNQLNPSQAFIDLTSYGTGNPYLRPEFANVFEMSYTFKQKTTITFDYTKAIDVISWIIKPIQTSDGPVSVETNDNIASNDYFGITLSNQLNITKWWSSISNANVFWNSFRGTIGNTLAQRGGSVFTMTSNQNFTLPKKWSAELSLNYRSSEQASFAYSKSQWMLSAGIQRLLMKNQATLRLNVSDIFRTFYPRVTSSFIDYEQYFTAFRDTRIASVSFTYRFGKNTVQAARRRTTGAEEESRRAN